MKNLVITAAALAVALVGCSSGMNSSTDHPYVRGRFVNKVDKCDGLVTDFTLDYDTRLTSTQATTLCSCVNDRYAVKGWEPAVLKKAQSGQIDSSNWKVKALVGRIGKAIRSCERTHNL